MALLNGLRNNMAYKPKMKFATDKDHFLYIKHKQEARYKNPSYKDCYTFLKISDEDIDFLIHFCDILLNKNIV
jgi:hypothetical protein